MDRLTPKQEDLLRACVQAARAYADPREEFFFTETDDGATVRHRGLPGPAFVMAAAWDDLKALLLAELLAGDPSRLTEIAFKVTDEGFAYCDRMTA